ncbi:MAG: hypothetical protein ACI9OJ_000173 [Myxococcota bacterium]|jgi:hypothetical protein
MTRSEKNHQKLVEGPVGKTLIELAIPMVLFVRLVVLAVPLAWVGSRLFDLPVLFAGISLANVIIGLLALAVVHRRIAHVERSLSGGDALAGEGLTG